MKETHEGFLINTTYKIEEQESTIYLFGRLKNKKSFCVKKKIKPYFFAKEKEEETIKKTLENTRHEIEKTEYKNFQEEKLIKIIFTNQQELTDAKKTLDEKNINHYESDIKPEYKELIDLDIKGSLTIQGTPIKNEEHKTDLFFDEPTLTKSDWVPKYEDLVILAIDIETSMNTEQLYSVSLATNNEVEEVLIIGKEKLNKATTYENEEELIKKLIEKINKINPDIITGWNLIDFDLKILQDKIKENKQEFKITRTNQPINLKITESFMTDSKAECEGRAILDGIHLLKTSFIKLDDYKLGTAAKTYTDSQKLIGDENKGEEIENAYEKNPQKLVDYNLLDSKLVLKILKKSGALELTILRSKLTGMPLDRVRASIASFDSLYLRKLHEKKYAAPSNKFYSREERTTGGFVMDSASGIYNYVIVCDFKSLYPSIMRTFNIDPLMHTKNCEQENLIHAPNGACFKKEQGILPLILEELWDEREKARIKKDNLTRQAIKILMNSMYGVLASPNCRFYNTELANAITHFGHFLLKKTREIIEQKGYVVIYGDTDSVFVSIKANNYEEAQKIGEELQIYINNFFKEYIEKEYGTESKIELEFEKTYKKFFLPRARGSEEGAKKRYAGLLIEKEQEKIDFTGLEFVRRDWTEVSKKFQLELLDLVFKEKDVKQYIKRFVEDLKNGKYDDLLVYRKALRKDVDDYTKTTPPHVKAARLLDKITTNIIDYVMTTEGPEPIQKQTNKIDYEHYIDKQIKPLADSILCFFETNFEETIAGSQQKTLGDW